MTQQIFYNAQVDISELPSAFELDWRPLQHAYRSLLLISTGFGCAVFITLVSLSLPFLNFPTWIPLTAVGVILCISGIQVLSIVKGFPYKGYALRVHDMLYRTGWLYKKQIAIPLIRVQHVDMRQGLIERIFGLYRINIYTAGGDSSDLTIPGLLEIEAQRLKKYILRETTSQDEEE
jgi:membrane protein YdbS with pleckstrin-like domain